jgi:hypothetical protein
MPVTNPWPAGPSPIQVLPRDALEERILNLLSSQNMCVLATVGADSAPLATPVRYANVHFEIMFTASPRSPKVRNLGADAGFGRHLRPAGRPGQQPRSTTVRYGQCLANGPSAASTVLGGRPLAVRSCRALTRHRRPAIGNTGHRHREPDRLHRALAASRRIRPAPVLER